MAKSTKSRRANKPRKPYDGFPLFPHVNGRWAKKIRGRLHYFGRWGSRRNGEMVPVEDLEASASEALEQFNREWPYLKNGRTPPPVADDDCTVAHLANVFLNAKRQQMDGGELSERTFRNYYVACQRLVSTFGADRPVDDLRPDDFARLRKSMAARLGVTSLKNEIKWCKIVLKFAYDQRLIDRPVHFGQSFNPPSLKQQRKARNAAGPKLFEADEIRRILRAADPTLRAMVLLGINCGFGNTDVANLPRSAVDLESGWIEFPRPKTEIPRRVPLWPETIAALRETLAMRPAPRDRTDAGLCFLTPQGRRWVRSSPSRKHPDTTYTVNTLAVRFGRLLKRLKINGRRGLGFYTLRHNFQTIGGDAKDPDAVSAIMGHVDNSMAAVYRERISDERLQAVVEMVREWLKPWIIDHVLLSSDAAQEAVKRLQDD